MTTLVNISKKVFEFIGNLKNYSRNKFLVSGFLVSDIKHEAEYAEHVNIALTQKFEEHGLSQGSFSKESKFSENITKKFGNACKHKTLNTHSAFFT